MKLKQLIFLMLFLAVTMLSAEVLSVYDIQYSEDGTGNSIYMDQTVTVSGIVTAIGFEGDKFFISDPEGGAWKGLYIYDFDIKPNLGDLIELTGTVEEYTNLTRLSEITSSTVLSSGNQLPEPAIVTCSDLQLANAEEWEGVLIKVVSPTCSIALNPANGDFEIKDASGDVVTVKDGFFTYDELAPAEYDIYLSITGVIDFSWGTFSFAPRTLADVRQRSINIPELQYTGTETFDIPIRTYSIEDTEDIDDYDFVILFDEKIIDIIDYDVSGSITEEFDGVVTLTAPAPGEIRVTCHTGSIIIVDEDDALLITLVGKNVNYGTSPITFDYFQYEGADALKVFGSSIEIKYRSEKAYLEIRNDKNSKNIFNPRLNEEITIFVGAKLNSTGANSKVIVRIYDAQGRLKATPYNQVIDNNIGIDSFRWNGKSRDHRLLPPGMYICFVEVIDRNTGKKHVADQPIVISADL